MSYKKPRSAIWIVILRPYEDGIQTYGVISLREMVEVSHLLELTMRFNPDLRLVAMRLPPHTLCEQVYDALDLLSDDERFRLWCIGFAQCIV